MKLATLQGGTLLALFFEKENNIVSIFTKLLKY